MAPRTGASDASSRNELSLASAVGARPERLDRLPVARSDRVRRAREGGRRGRRRRRHLEPDHLREGARARATPTTSRSPPATRDARGVFLELAMRDVTTACDLLRPVWERTRGWRRLRLDRGRPEPGRRHRGHDRASDALPRGDRAPQPAGQDPGHRCRRAGDRGDDRARLRDQRDPDLLAHPPPPGGRGLPRAGSSGLSPRAATRVASTRSPASSSPASTPRPTAASPKPVGTTSRGASASPTPSSPTSSTRSCSTASVGTLSPRAARPRSAASGRRLRSRIQACATRSTSRS